MICKDFSSSLFASGKLFCTRFLPQSRYLWQFNPFPAWHLASFTICPQGKLDCFCTTFAANSIQMLEEVVGNIAGLSWFIPRSKRIIDA